MLGIKIVHLLRGVSCIDMKYVGVWPEEGLFKPACLMLCNDMPRETIIRMVHRAQAVRAEASPIMWRRCRRTAASLGCLAFFCGGRSDTGQENE